jgi:hypothetical protein
MFVIISKYLDMLYIFLLGMSIIFLFLEFSKKIRPKRDTDKQIFR